MTWRTLKRIVPVLPLLALICLVALWTLSYSWRDVMTCYIGKNDEAFWCESVRGAIQLVFAKNFPVDQLSLGWSTKDTADPLPSSLHWGFGYYHDTVPIWDGAASRRLSLQVMMLPYWAIMIFLLTLLLIGVWGSIRRKSAKDEENRT